MRLEKANAKFKKTFIEAVKEVSSFPESKSSTDWYKNLDIAELEEKFDDYVLSLLKMEDKKYLKEGYVTGTTFWMIDDTEKYVGRISLRHYLNAQLEKMSGHIGYDVIPSERLKGYSTLALKLCLDEARKIGLYKVLLTCDEDNIGSKKSIERNGGIYQDKLMNEGKTVLTLRYWITL